MRLRDISIEKRITGANFLMVFVPLCLLMPMVGLLVHGLHHSSAARLTELTWLWPEKGPMLTVQYLVSELRVKVEKDKKLGSILKTCRLLEAQGIVVVVRRRDEILYSTEGFSATAIEERVARLAGRSAVMELWNEDGFIFRCASRRSGLSVSACGSVPFMMQSGISEGIAKGIIEAVLLTIIAAEIIVVVMLGRYLSRLLSRQILEPLSALRAAALRIRSGELDAPLEVTTFDDEIGETCRTFETMRRELVSARDLKARYENNRKELIAGISHDLATPLTALKGYISGLRDGIVRTEEKRRHYVEMMYETTAGMERLTDELFLFSKLDLGRVEFQSERVSMREYFADFVEEKKIFYAERGLTLRLTDGSTDGTIAIDRIQLARVVDNLLDNSLKYRRGDGVTVEIDVRRENDLMRIAFADDGSGVEADQLPRLFESFYRTDSARSNTSKGSGLGLAIVKQIIETMGGSVRAEASALGGLSIVMTLPLAKDGEAKI